MGRFSPPTWLRPKPRHRSGFIGSGQIGGDYQFANNWMVGVQGMCDAGRINSSHVTTAFPTFNMNVCGFFPSPIKNPGIVRGFFYAANQCAQWRWCSGPGLGRDSFDQRQTGGCPVLLRGAETHTRSILKAVSWRTLGTLDTFAISWFLTGRVEIAGSIAALEIITKVAWYYLHERVWSAIPWGRRH